MPEPSANLAPFTFLVGNWRCEAKLKAPDGPWQSFHAAWSGRYILDGHAIADEFRMRDASGETIVLGVNIRAYDRDKQTWNIKWLDALTGRWTDLGPERLGGVTIEGNTIVYAFDEPMAGHPYTRATYTNHSPTHFTWRGERSDDAKSWSEFMIVEAYRDDRNGL